MDKTPQANQKAISLVYDSIKTLSDLKALQINNPQVEEVLQARLNKPLHQEKANEVTKLVNGVLAEVVITIGQKNIDDLQSQIIETDVHEMIRRRFSHWTAQEFRMAMKMGALGELTDEPPRHLTSTQIATWLNAFDLKLRREATGELQKALKNKRLEQRDKAPERKLTKEEKREQIRREFDRHTQGKRIMGPTYVWKYLQELKLYNPTKEERWELLEEAIDAAKAECISMVQRKATSAAARVRMEIIKGFEENKTGSEIPDILKAAASERAVMRYFKKCIKAKKDPA